MSKNYKQVSAIWLSRILAVLPVVYGSVAAYGQTQPKDQAKHAQHAAATKATGTSDSLTEQLHELQAKVARLEASLQQGQHAQSGQTSGAMGMMKRKGSGGTGMKSGGGMAGGGMGMMEDMEMSAMGGGKGMGMGMMDEMMSMMSQKGGSGMAMMDDMDMMGMGAMGKTKGMSGMSMPSALPGFPGASHLYHIGASGFFLDHDDHITLNTQQKAALNAIKQKALLNGASTKRQIDEAEQALWELTAADEPQAEEIEAKIRSIESLRSDQRLAFIRAVGEAAKALTDEQRQSLLGTMSDCDQPQSAPKP